MTDLPSGTKRLAIYARVSTDEQKEGQTIDSQIRELENFAKDRSWPVIGVYKDEGWSGAVIARPELDRLRDDASKGVFDAVLINDVDRLARDVSHLGVLKRGLEKSGVDVIFRKLPADKSPTYNLMVNILGSFAEFEREMISDRVRRGRRHKVEVRKQHIGCIPPYGYRYVLKGTDGQEGHLEIEPKEAAVVKDMFTWVASEGLSARQVLKRLDALGIAPRKGGASWAKTSVLRILHCETYAGVWHYCKHQNVEREGDIAGYQRRSKMGLRLRDRSEWIALELPECLRLVDRAVWQQAQQQLIRNNLFSPRNEHHKYLLKGLVVCGGCNRSYVGNPRRHYFQYRCVRRCKVYPEVAEDVLNDAVWQAIFEVMSQPALLTAQVQQRTRDQSEQQVTAKAVASQAKAELQTIALEESRILEAYRQGVIDPRQLGAELDKLKRRRNYLDSQKAGADAALDGSESQAQKRSLEEFCALAAQAMEKLEFEEKQRFLRALSVKVIFEGTTLRIRGRLPLPASREAARSGTGLSPSSSQQAIAAPSSKHDARNPSGSGAGIATPSLEHCDRNPPRKSGSHSLSYLLSLKERSKSFRCFWLTYDFSHGNIAKLHHCKDKLGRIRACGDDCPFKGRRKSPVAMQLRGIQSWMDTEGTISTTGAFAD